jgi:OmpA-OmpF porin, OOP family
MQRTKTISILAFLFILSTVCLAGSPKSIKYENIILLVDQSDEMHEIYKGRRKHSIAKETARSFLENIPRNISLQGAIYSYGVLTVDDEKYCNQIREWAPLNIEQFQSSIDTIKPLKGPSSLSMAMAKVHKDLRDKNISGQTVIIVISGGNLSDVGNPVSEMGKIKDFLKNNVCVHTIYIGKDEKGGRNLTNLVKTGKCGEAVGFSLVNRNQEMNAYVHDIFFGTIGDMDKDHVPDDDDQCPNSPRGANTDERGCWTIYNINFDSAKWDIKPDDYEELEDIVETLNVNPEIHLLVRGHTDSQGSDELNQILSKKRAEAIMEYLVENGVNKRRLMAAGKGESEPIAENSTDQGMAKNRRIEFVVTIIY